MKKLRFGAALHFLIAIGHVCCLFALDEAFEAYGIKDFMHQMVSGHVWMLYALTIGLAFALYLDALAVSMTLLGYDVSRPSFPLLSHGATGLELIWGGERPKSFVFSIVNDESKTLTND